MSAESYLEGFTLNGSNVIVFRFPGIGSAIGKHSFAVPCIVVEYFKFQLLIPGVIPVNKVQVEITVNLGTGPWSCIQNRGLQCVAVIVLDRLPAKISSRCR